MFGPARHRSASVYELLGEQNNLGEHTRYINLGYWKNANTYDKACEALVDLVGQWADIKPHHRVLDVGCGFGEQDVRWLQQYTPQQLTAINITPLHIEKARERFQNPDRFTHPALDFQLASATDLPFARHSFDRIVGLESAFHFNTRRDFFREAMRVLKPGGTLTLADTVPLKNPENAWDSAKYWLMGGLWQVPLCNYYNLDTYQHHLHLAGFTDIITEDISAHVWAPFKEFAQQRVQDTEIRARVHPLLRKIWGTPHKAAEQIQYVLISATKP